ncbi:MAG: CPBP family intramembrane metalloprotease [Planctomycetia bacterium]|nr:CPBP family intramembrane metalloprotease [Planctomycetia bacterium]
MSERANDPPLVLRPPDAVARPAAPSKPGPGLLEAAIWCGVFLAGQVFGAVVGVCVVFGLYALRAPDAGAFVDEQFAGLGKSIDSKTPDGQKRPEVPFEIGQSLASGMLAAQFVSLGMILIVVPRRVGPDWKRQLAVRAPARLHVVIVLLLVPGFIFLTGAIQEFFVEVTGLKPPVALESLSGIFGKFPWPLTFMAVALGPGLVEELWCRGFLGRGLSARYGLLAGVVLTSVLFAVMHLDPSQVLIIALMGAYLHFVYLATRSIWMPILLHTLNNGLAIFLALTLKLPPEGEQHTPPILLLVSFSLMLFGTVALWTSRATAQPLRKATDAGKGSQATNSERAETSEWKPEYPGISVPPPEANVRLENEPVSPVALVFALVSFGVIVYLMIDLLPW